MEVPPPRELANVSLPLLRSQLQPLLAYREPVLPAWPLNLASLAELPADPFILSQLVHVFPLA